LTKGVLLRVALYFVLGAQEADQAHGLRLPIDYAEHNPFFFLSRYHRSDVSDPGVFAFRLRVLRLEYQNSNEMPFSAHPA
jgi:hypothetical protein